MENDFRIQKEILDIQWTNIRFYWDKSNHAVAQTTALPIVVLFGNLLKSQANLSAHAHSVVKGVSRPVWVVGIFVFLTLKNYYERSLRARLIVVEIEKLWKLYEKDGLYAIRSQLTNIGTSPLLTMSTPVNQAANNFKFAME